MNMKSLSVSLIIFDFFQQNLYFSLYRSFTSLVKFISKYFIVFDAIVNEIVFFFKNLLFIFGCIGSLLLCAGFL